MASQINNYQCPACSGPLRFDGVSGMLVCDYCGSNYQVAQIEAMYAEQEKAAQAAMAQANEQLQHEAQQAAQDGQEYVNYDQERWGENMKGYSCPSCGAELVCDNSTAATSCPYCGNPTVIPGQFAGMEKPDYIIPFKLDKKHAEDALYNHYKGKKFLPDAFTKDNHVKKVQGVYVPFWVYDGTAQGRIMCNCTNSQTHTEGDYRVTRTQHYHVTREGNAGFHMVPADASSKMPDDYMDSIEPYDYNEMREFSSAYLPGFLADKYDVSKEECSKRIIPRIENSLVHELEKTVIGYGSCITESKDVHSNLGKISYAMMPVWLLCTKWNGQDYLFAMNGQTGKMVGNLPIDKGKVFKWFFGISLPLMTILSVLFFVI